MTLNTSQVSYYMTQRKKGATQHISAMKAGISVRSGRRIEKDQWSKAGERHWRTRKDPLEAVWDSELVPLLKERPALMPTTLLEMLQDKYLVSTPTTSAGQCSGGSVNGSCNMVRSRRSCSASGINPGCVVCLTLLS